MAKLDLKPVGRAKPAQTKTKGDALPFTKKNYYIFLGGLLAIIIGYIALSQGSITLAPLLLVLGYCVIIPIAILYRGSDETPAEQPNQGA